VRYSYQLRGSQLIKGTHKLKNAGGVFSNDARKVIDSYDKFNKTHFFSREVYEILCFEDMIESILQTDLHFNTDLVNLLEHLIDKKVKESVFLPVGDIKRMVTKIIMLIQKS
jgi:hypothetical protein